MNAPQVKYYTDESYMNDIFNTDPTSWSLLKKDLRRLENNERNESTAQRETSIKQQIIRIKYIVMSWFWIFNADMYLALVVWSVFESVLCTACIFGWAQLLEILENEQYFSSYCGHEAKSNFTIISQTNTSKSNSSEYVNKRTCGEQDSVLRMAYTISVFATFASIFLSGKYLDKFGFRKTRILAR